MNTYKITNITNQLNKRDIQYSTNVNVQYVDKMIKKTLIVKPGESVFLSIEKLPISIYKLKIKNLILVSFVDAAELENLMNKSKVMTDEKLDAVIEQSFIPKKKNKKEIDSK